MDNRVYISFGSVTLIAVFLIIYKLAYACCSIPVITSSAEDAFQGVEVMFSNAGDNRELSWNFGDGSPEVTGHEVGHVFSRTGDMQVTAVYNGQCEAQLLVNIRPVEQSGPKEVEPLVNFTQEVKVKESVVLSDMTPGATKWEWMVVGGESEQTGTGREFKTAFNNPGTYTISLRVDGDKITGTRDLSVTVLPKTGSKPNTQTVVITPPLNPRPPRGGKAVELNTAEFIQICSDYNAADVIKKRAQRDRYRDLVQQHFGKMGTRITFEGASDLEVSAPDFATLSRILYQYNVKDVKLVPGLPDKNGFRQYKTMVVTLEEISK